MIKRFTRRWNGEGGYGELLRIAFPLILGTSAWSVQHFVDRMFLAWYSPEAIAASVPAGILNFTLISLFVGTVGYVGVFVAQYYGAGRLTRIGPVLWQSLYASIFGGIFILGMIPFSLWFFKMVGHDPLVQANEVIYFKILCLGGFPTIASAAFSGFFTGLGRAWPVMWVNSSSTIVNLSLDYALIFGNWGFPEMGIKGAAIASVFAAFFALISFIVLVFTKKNKKTFNLSAGRFWIGFGIEKELFFRLIRYGFPSGIQFFLDMAGFTCFILFVGRLGMTSLAATNIAFNINTLAFLPMIGTGMAVSVLVGQYLGKDEYENAKTSVNSGFHLTFLYMATIAAAYVLVPDIFVAPFAAQSDPENFSEIRRTTVILLRFVAVYSLFDTMNIIYASAIKGAGDTRFVMLMILVVSLFVLVIPTYIAIEILDFGLMASWGIASVYVIFLGLIFLFRFLQGKWQKMRVIEKQL